MAVKVKLNLAGLRELKRSPGVTAEIQRLGSQIRSAAAANSPDATGDFIYLNIETHPIAGSVAHIGSALSTSMAIEAKHGVLARALDAAGGS